MKLITLKQKFTVALEGLYPEQEISSFFYILVQHYYQISRLQLAMDTNLTVDKPDLITNALALLKKHTPIQYITSRTEFYGLNFEVNKNTLIPRPETEELVDWIVNTHKNKTQPIHILDIGTGSGCIAIALAKNLPKAKVYAIDVSEQAIEVAIKNAKNNHANVVFLKQDILNNAAVNLDQIININFDVIVSNPPYVRELEKKLMHNNVLNYEPHLALFVENNEPLKFYTAITKFAKVKLKNQGALFFEINEYLGLEMKQLLEEFNFKNIELKQDFFNKDRMLKGEL